MALEIARALLPVFFVMAVGFAAGKTRLVDNRDVRSLNTLVMTIALPLALFAVLASSPRADVVEHGWMALVSLLVMAVVYGAAFVLQRRVFRATPGEAAVQALTVSFPNAAAVALFLTGLVLSAQPIRVDAQAIVATVLTVLVRPLLALGVIVLLGWTGAMAQETLLLLAVPAGFFGILVGIGYGAKPPVAGSTLLFSSVLSIATLSLVITMLPAL